jgi:hypothetical protein
MNEGVKLPTNNDEDHVDPTLLRQLIGSLIYLTTKCLDNSFVVRLCFMSDPQ